MKCPKIRSESSKSSSRLFKLFIIIVSLVLLLAGCGEKPVNVADELDAEELWSMIQGADMTEMPDDRVSADTEPTDNSESESFTSENEAAMSDAEDTVFFTRIGSVWHRRHDCPTLSDSDDILIGSISEAVEQGKSRACKRCK